MAQKGLADRLAVCSWSLQPQSPQDLAEKLAQIGLTRIQLDMMPLLHEPAWADAGSRLTAMGVEIIGGMMRCEGEDYSTPQAIKETGGIVPDNTWPTTWENMRKIAPIARDMGMTYLMFHAGFLPHEQSDPNFEKLVGRLRQVADLFADNNAVVGLETGQEAADTLLAFLDVLDRPNVRVNYDPGNMILYDMDDPIEALRKLLPHVEQCHLKDAKRTTVKGEWGTELPVGEGEVDWDAFFSVLGESDFEGYLAFEREDRDQRVLDIQNSYAHVKKALGV